MIPTVQQTSLQGHVDILILLGRTVLISSFNRQHQLHWAYANSLHYDLLELHPSAPTTHMIDLHFEPILNTE